MTRPDDCFDLADPQVHALLGRFGRVWEVLGALPELTAGLLQGRRVIEGDVSPGAWIDDGPVFIGAGATIEPGAYVKGPAYIGCSAVVRHGAYVREDSILLAGSSLGHASECKNALLLPEAKAPHFAYVGDSILGHRVNLGAGVKLGNVPISPRRGADGRRPTIQLDVDGARVDTGLRKFGAVIGDDVQVGCNAVFSPGVIMGPRCVVYANATVAKGVYAADRMLKLRQTLVTAERDERG
ncbi:hypothetical protein AB0K00_49150 [Dactylosporangium sp. NPDC049525]|uniref:hypothetical protein n=1 Tax=Dactylosporangium sp. NPDC049525 TaxID=3154730 RepID=UPI0034251357